MRIALDYRSSAPLWRASRPSTSTIGWRSRILSLEGFSSSHCTPQLERLAALEILEPPISLLVNSDRKKSRTRLAAPKLWTSPLVSNSLYRLADVPGFENLADDQIYISSPEFCLLQAAATHSLAQTILYGMEICGTFTPIVGSDDLPKRVQLTSAKRIAAYIERASGSRGYRTASEAVPFILDGSASPMESKLAMKLCLPKCKGGMGFPAPTLNEELPLEELPSELAGADSYRFDLWWRDKGLVVEYDSEKNHTGRSRITHDSIRRNVIDYLGIDIITVTPDQLMNAESFALIALEIARHLGIRMRPPAPAVLRARQKLDRELFPWRYRR